MIPKSGRIVGVDWGERRIGIAISDETQLLASPLTTLTRRPEKRFPMATFLEQIAPGQPVGIVVGLPLESSGEEGDSARAARALAKDLEARTRLPVETWDERMSTAKVLSAIREQGGARGKPKEAVDAAAAAVLLQHYLDARRGGI